MESSVEVKMVKSDHEYLKDIRKNVISLPPPLLRIVRSGIERAENLVRKIEGFLH